MTTRNHKTELRALLLGIVTIVAIRIDGYALMLCIDPGHGGTDAGTVTGIPQYNEEDINLDIAFALQDTLLGVRGNR